MHTSRLYAAALALLGLTLLFSVIQLLTSGMFLMSVPGAGTLLHILNLVGIVMAPAARVVMGVVLILLAIRHAKGQLLIPATSYARVGKLLAILGLLAGVVFFAWRFYVQRQGPQASIFLSFGPANFWLSSLYAGVGLVEGSRILGLRHDS